MVREFLKNHKWLQEDMDMKRFAALIASAALVLSGYSSNVQVFAAADDSETDENIWETVEDAYVYAFPLVLMDATETSATNTEEAVTGKAPVNQFIHSVALANAQFRNVVTPNVDTIYSQVWYDLSEEPMVYELPETDRFCKVQVLDAWTNTAAVLDQAGAICNYSFYVGRGTARGRYPYRCSHIHGMVYHQNHFIRRRGSAKCACHSGKNETNAAFQLYIRRNL